MKFSRSYMKNEEFKTRQTWLDFKDAVGTALEAIAPSMDAIRQWFKDWKKDFVTKAPKTVKPHQYFLDFGLKIIEIHRKAA